MGEVDAQIAVLKYEVGALREEIVSLKQTHKEEINALKMLHIETNEKLGGIVTTANKATGGFIVLVALGSVLTWGTSIGEKLAKWFH